MKTTIRSIDKKDGIELVINEASRVKVDEFNNILETFNEPLFIGATRKVTPDSEPFSLTISYIEGKSLEEVFEKLVKELREKNYL